MFHLKKYLFILLIFLTHCAPSLYDVKPAFYAYIVGDVKTGKVEKELYADAYITPASCQKVITALLAYKDLGPEYCYRTCLYKAGRNAVISFSGDPTLTMEDIRALLKKFPGKPKKVILDLSVFKTQGHSKNIMVEDIGLKFAQPVTAATVDKNLFNITVDEKGGVSSELDYPITTDIEKGEIASLKIRWENHHLHIYGTYAGSLVFAISPPDITSYLMKKIPKSCVAFSYIPGKNEKLIAEHFSKPLREILPPAFKLSSNLPFDALYLTLLHKNVSKIQDWDDGDKMVKDLMKKYYDVDMGESRTVDGSGLSRYNRIQPRVLFEILCKGKSDLFLDAFPHPGEDESSIKTYVEWPNTILAKNGRVSGINNLCGYYKNKAFVFAASGFVPPVKEMHGRLAQELS